MSAKGKAQNMEQRRKIFRNPGIMDTWKVVFQHSRKVLHVIKLNDTITSAIFDLSIC